MDVYTVQRTGLDYSDLRDAHDTTQIGDVILFNGRPTYRVATRTTLSFYSGE